MPKITPVNYVRIILTDLKNTRYVLGLQHSIIGFQPDPKVLIPLTEINNDPEDFFMGDDTAPIYSGFLQFRFNEKDGAEIRDYFSDLSEFSQVQLVNEDYFLENVLELDMAWIKLCLQGGY